MSFEYHSVNDEYVMRDACSRSDGFMLPNIEVFELSEFEIGEFHHADPESWADRDGEMLKPGWYWWPCLPGCLPDADPMGPFETKELALADARGE